MVETFAQMISGNMLSDSILIENETDNESQD